VLETAVLCERDRESTVIGIGCKTVEDNGNNQEVSCTAGTLLYSLIEPRTSLAICPKCKLLEEETLVFKLRRKLLY
jgi:hypothetical protein